MPVTNPPVSLQLRLSYRFLIVGALALALTLFAPPRPLQAGSMMGWTDTHCGRCHEPDTLFSHPLDVEPTMITPGDLPLVEGKLACITCHETDALSHSLARQRHSPLLRSGMSVSELCSRCHDSMQLSRSAQHGTNLNRAHYFWPRKAPSAGSDSRTGADTTTQLCQSCHDGLISTDSGGSGMRLASGVMAEHPIGVTMSSTFSDVALRTSDSLDSRIRLSNNRVECLSCHSPYSHQDKLLVMSNERSALCLSCHIQ